MPNKLTQELEAALPKGMRIPQPIIQLYEWIVSKQFYKEREDATCGFLYSEQEMNESRTDDSRAGGTNIEFATSCNVNLRYWFGTENE